MTYTYWTNAGATTAYATPTAASAGTYYIKGTDGSNGCYTIESVTVTVNVAYSYSDNYNICSGDTYNWQGIDYSTGGNYYANYTSIYGCDSNYTLNLAVNTVDTGITINGNTITANAASGTFQWVDCDNNYAWISGETGQSYTATVDGNYAVIVTQGSCSDTSSCYQMVITAIEHNPFGSSFSVYPNPTSGDITLDLGGNYFNVDIRISDVLGQVFYRTHNISVTKTINLAIEEAPGIYFIDVITSEGKTATIKVVKN